MLATEESVLWASVKLPMLRKVCLVEIGSVLPPRFQSTLPVRQNEFELRTKANCSSLKYLLNEVV